MKLGLSKKAASGREQEKQPSIAGSDKTRSGNELETRRKEMVELAFENLKANATKAVQTLVKHLDSEKGTMSIRAAESILEFAHKGTERQPNKDLPSHETFDLDSYLTDYQKEQLRYGRERRLTLKSSGGSGWDRDKEKKD